MVLDEKSAEKLYKRLHLVESDKGTYKIALEIVKCGFMRKPLFATL